MGTLMTMMRSLHSGMLIAPTLLVPGMMAMWVAPALILFNNNKDAVDAMKRSSDPRLQSLSIMVTLAMPPPSHIVCRP